MKLKTISRKIHNINIAKFHEELLKIDGLLPIENVGSSIKESVFFLSFDDNEITLTMPDNVNESTVDQFVINHDPIPIPVPVKLDKRDQRIVDAIDSNKNTLKTAALDTNTKAALNGLLDSLRNAIIGVV